jgi:hypothetical protein
MDQPRRNSRHPSVPITIEYPGELTLLKCKRRVKSSGEIP